MPNDQLPAEVSVLLLSGLLLHSPILPDISGVVVKMFIFLAGATFGAVVTAVSLVLLSFWAAQQRAEK